MFASNPGKHAPTKQITNPSSIDSIVGNIIPDRRQYWPASNKAIFFKGLQW
jgi:hypothetical protein